MIRFVDLRGQGTGNRFAYWDTCVDRFREYDGEMAWNTFDEFAEVYQGDELDRFRRLTPGWAHQPGEDDTIGFYMGWTETLRYRQEFPMRIAFDIGGVISKYPDDFRRLMGVLEFMGLAECHIITDMHDREATLQLLKDNGFGFIPEDNVHNSDYDKHGEFCKSLLLKQLEIDIFIDDFPGYVQWDSKLGKAPIRLLMQPDPFRPYWAESWVTPDGSDFGRRVAPQELIA